jgi:hypothetical protein
MIVIAVPKKSQAFFNMPELHLHGSISDNDGKWVQMPVHVMRTATREEYLKSVNERGGHIFDWALVDDPETEFFLVSID